jgi:hypothetical protein
MTFNEKETLLIRIQKNIALCVTYAKTSDYDNQVKMLDDQLQFLLPCVGEDIDKIDKKLDYVTDDLKVALFTKKEPIRINRKINKIIQLLDERNSII